MITRSSRRCGAVQHTCIGAGAADAKNQLLRRGARGRGDNNNNYMVAHRKTLEEQAVQASDFQKFSGLVVSVLQKINAEREGTKT